MKYNTQNAQIKSITEKTLIVGIDVGSETHFANNRAYYAIFHAVSAVLAMKGVAFKKHKDTLAYFNKNYVATEIFSRNLGRKIVKAEEIRHESDYDTFYIASKEITVEQIQTAEQLIELVEVYCNV